MNKQRWAATLTTLATIAVLAFSANCAQPQQLSEPTPTALAAATPNTAITPTPTPTIQATAVPPTPTLTPTPTATPTPTPSPSPTSTPTPTPDGPVVIIDGIPFAAEIADTPALRQLGLGERDSLKEQSGMLFVFPDGKASSFWMHGMRFPLDFIWISAECSVADLTQDVQHAPPDTPPAELAIYGSRAPAAYNFEVNAGEAQRFGIDVGDKVRFVNIQSEQAGCCENEACE